MPYIYANKPESEMEREKINSNLGIILAAGAIWGLVEFGAGMGLQKCATLITGAVLTGLSFFWFSFIWTAVRRVIPIIMIVIIAMLFKWLDAWLLDVAWNHGSVLNPMFAFFTAMIGFLVFIFLFRQGFSKLLWMRILVGSGAALIAVCLFPLAKFATGIPACTFASTNIPLAIYTAPVTILISMVTVPLGYRAALWYRSLDPDQSPAWLHRIWSPAVLAGCVLIMILVRVI
jgi:hypothetical protein